MNVKRQLKKYYLSRIEIQKVPELEKILQWKVPKKTTEKRQGILALNLVFFAGLFICLALILAFNSNTSQSLQRLDPGSQKSFFVQQKVKEGLDKVKSYFRPNPAPVK